jgi:hypothetical protein
VVTALTQSVLAGVALWLFGIPHAGVLMAIAFVFSVAQIGPLPVLAAAVLWLYWTGSTGAAIGLVVLSLPVIMLDNVLRPVADPARRGAPDAVDRGRRNRRPGRLRRGRPLHRPRSASPLPTPC